MGWTSRTRKPTTADGQRPPLTTGSRTPRMTATRSDAQALRTGGLEHLVQRRKSKGCRTEAPALRRAIWADVLAGRAADSGPDGERRPVVLQCVLKGK